MWGWILVTYCMVIPAKAQNWFLHGIQLNSGIQIEVTRCVHHDFSGNRYTAGYFTGGFDADPGPGTQWLNSLGAQDIFIQKWSPQGDLLAIGQIGGTGQDMVYDLEVDLNGRVWLCGFFNQMSDFDPGSGVLWKTTNSMSGQDAFVLCLDTAFQFQWVETLGGFMAVPGTAILPQAIAYAIQSAYPEPGVYVCGSLLGLYPITISTQTDTLGNQHFSQAWLAKWQGNGNLQWIKSWGETGKGTEAYQITHKNGLISATGVCRDTTDLYPGPDSLVVFPIAQLAGFLIQLDTSGDFVEAQLIDGLSFNDHIRPLNLIQPNNEYLYIAGQFRGNISGNGQAGDLCSIAQWDGFLMKRNSAGTMEWLRGFHGTGNDYLQILRYKPPGSLLLGGNYTGSLDTDPGTGTHIIQSTTLYASDFFALETDTNGTWINTWTGGGPSVDQLLDIDVISPQQILFGGTFSGQADLDPGPSVQTKQALGSLDGFLIDMTSAGSVLSIPNAWTLRAFKSVYGVEISWSLEEYPQIDELQLIRRNIVHNTKLESVLTLPESVWMNGIHRYTDTVHVEGSVGYQLHGRNTEGQQFWSNEVYMDFEKKTNWLITPNPVGKNISVHSPYSIKGAILGLYNTQGQLVFEEVMSAGNHWKFSIPDLAQGIYYLKISPVDTSEVSIYHQQLIIGR